MADDMTRVEFTEYMQAFERRLDGRFESLEQRLGSVEHLTGSVEHRLGSVEHRLESLEQHMGSFEQHMGFFEQRMGSFEQHMGSFEQRTDSFEHRMESFEHRMQVRFEDLRGDLRLSFEGLATLRETTEKGFDELRTRSDEQIALVEAALTHVRRRVERVERRRR